LNANTLTKIWFNKSYDVLKPALAAIALMLSCAAPVAAGPLKDATAAVKRRDYATALRFIRLLAEQGDASAQYKLEFLYDNGLGAPLDHVRPTCGSPYRRRRAKMVQQFFETSLHGA